MQAWNWGAQATQAASFAAPQAFPGQVAQVYQSGQVAQAYPGGQIPQAFPAPALVPGQQLMTNYQQFYGGAMPTGTTEIPAGYTPQQWEAAQQQHFLQWQQWNQQYQQWQQEYGNTYSMAVQGDQTALPPSMAAEPPPLPPPDKPPPPPEENRGELQNFHVPPPESTSNFKGQKRPTEDDQSKYQGPADKKQRGDNFQQFGRDGAVDTWGSATDADVPDFDEEDRSEQERVFDSQFLSWEGEFISWKEQNINHPDKNQYHEYEKRWTKWRQELLARREQMRKKRLAGGTKASPDAAVTKSRPKGDRAGFSDSKNPRNLGNDFQDASKQPGNFGKDAAPGLHPEGFGCRPGQSNQQQQQQQHVGQGVFPTNGKPEIKSLLDLPLQFTGPYANKGYGGAEKDDNSKAVEAGNFVDPQKPQAAPQGDPKSFPKTWAPNFQGPLQPKINFNFNKTGNNQQFDNANGSSQPTFGPNQKPGGPLSTTQNLATDSGSLKIGQNATQSLQSNQDFTKDVQLDNTTPLLQKSDANSTAADTKANDIIDITNEEETPNYDFLKKSNVIPGLDLFSDKPSDIQKKGQSNENKTELNVNSQSQFGKDPQFDSSIQTSQGQGFEFPKGPGGQFGPNKLPGQGLMPPPGFTNNPNLNQWPGPNDGKQGFGVNQGQGFQGNVPGFGPFGPIGQPGIVPGNPPPYFVPGNQNTGAAGGGPGNQNQNFGPGNQGLYMGQQNNGQNMGPGNQNPNFSPGNMGPNFTGPGNMGSNFTSPGNMGSNFTSPGNMGANFTSPGNKGQHFGPGNMGPNFNSPGNKGQNMGPGNQNQSFGSGNMGPNFNNSPGNQGPNMGPGNNQGPNMGPGNNQGSNMGPGNNQGPNMGLGYNQGPNMGPGNNQGPNMGPGNNQGPNMGPGNNQGPNMGPVNNQGFGPGNMGQNFNPNMKGPNMIPPLIPPNFGSGGPGGPMNMGPSNQNSKFDVANIGSNVAKGHTGPNFTPGNQNTKPGPGNQGSNFGSFDQVNRNNQGFGNQNFGPKNVDQAGFMRDNPPPRGPHDNQNFSASQFGSGPRNWSESQEGKNHGPRDNIQGQGPKNWSENTDNKGPWNQGGGGRDPQHPSPLRDMNQGPRDNFPPGDINQRAGSKFPSGPLNQFPPKDGFPDGNKSNVDSFSGGKEQFSKEGFPQGIRDNFPGQDKFGSSRDSFSKDGPNFPLNRENFPKDGPNFPGPRESFPKDAGAFPDMRDRALGVASGMRDRAEPNFMGSRDGFPNEGPDFRGPRDRFVDDRDAFQGGPMDPLGPTRESFPSDRFPHNVREDFPRDRFIDRFGPADGPRGGYPDREFDRDPFRDNFRSREEIFHGDRNRNMEFDERGNPFFPREHEMTDRDYDEFSRGRGGERGNWDQRGPGGRPPPDYFRSRQFDDREGEPFVPWDRAQRPPGWENAVELEPVTIVEYGHKPAPTVPIIDSTPAAPISLEHVQTFDYGHGATPRNARDLAPPVASEPYRRDEFFGRQERETGREQDRDKRSYERDGRWDRDRGDRERERGRREDDERGSKYGTDEDRFRSRTDDRWGRRGERDNDRDRNGRSRDNKRDVESGRGNKSGPPPSAPPPPSFSGPSELGKGSTPGTDMTSTSSGPTPPAQRPILVEDLLSPPGRDSRPQRIVVILRGPPGSGKTFVAKLIKDKEVEMGGPPPRILCLDDYFMVEVEKEEKDSESGRKVKVKVMEYEYEAGMEKDYRCSLVKAFKKTVNENYFPFIIVDCVNQQVKNFEEMWSYAKQKGFQVYICEMDMDVSSCIKRNTHNRTEKEIAAIVKAWEETPKYYLRLDVRSLLQSVAITEVEMEDSTPNDEEEKKEEKEKEKTPEEEGIEADEVRPRIQPEDKCVDKTAEKPPCVAVKK